MELHKPEAALNQDRIISAALSLIRKHGFDGFSMRALASSLGVTVGATYRHFGGKEKILTVAADQILAAIPLSDGNGDWRRAFLENAEAYRDTFREYPGVAAYLTLHLGETSIRQDAIERSLHLLTDAGLTRSEALHTAGALNAFLRASAGDGDAPPGTGAGRPANPTTSPRRLELDQGSFRFGLNLLIGGIEKLLETRRLANDLEAHASDM